MIDTWIRLDLLIEYWKSMLLIGLIGLIMGLQLKFLFWLHKEK